MAAATTTWTCPACEAKIPASFATEPRGRTEAGVYVMRVKVTDSFLADAYAHLWTEHPDVEV